MIDVSIIIAFHNERGTVARCLEAVCTQELDNRSYEVIAIDNASTDGSGEIAQALSKDRQRLRVLKENEPGAYVARNKGLAESSGRIVVFTDADCIPSDDWLANLIEAIEKPGAKIVMGRDRPAGRSLGVRLLAEYDHYKEELVLSGADASFYYGHTNNLVTTRAALDQVGPFVPRPRGSDVVLVHRVLDYYGTESVRYEPAALVEHLEVDSVWVYFKKGFTYGRSARRYASLVSARPLTTRWRLAVFSPNCSRKPLEHAASDLSLFAASDRCLRLSVRLAVNATDFIQYINRRNSMSAGLPILVKEGGLDQPPEPVLSVVTVTASTFAILRRTVRFLREQTIANQIELILVGPDAETWEDMQPHELDGFGSWRLIAAGPIVEVERGYVAGTPFVKAPVVALLENHVFCDPDWAEVIVKAHEGPWSAVGTVIRNANRATAASWVEHFLTYGFHDVVTPGGETTHIARNNSSYKSSLFKASRLTDDDARESFQRLEDLLARDGGFLPTLLADGHRFYREVGAGMDHLNPSQASAVLKMRFPSARASAATRARLAGWSSPKRLLYVLVSPLFPILRLRALWPKLRKHPEPHLWRIAPLMMVGLLVDALGQAVGFALGAGNSAVETGLYDLDRSQYLIDSERARFVDDGA